jgi:hypothetical protein
MAANRVGYLRTEVDWTGFRHRNHIGYLRTEVDWIALDRL